MPTKDGKQTRKEKSAINKANYAKIKEQLAKDAKAQRESKIEAQRNSDEFFNQILEELFTGKSLSKILKENRATNYFYAKLKEDEEFRNRYLETRSLVNQIEFEEIKQIADERPREINDAQGNKIYDKTELEWRKLRIEAAKWSLAKREPKKYGDKLELAGDPTAPVKMQIEWMSEK